jgi:ribokinase
MGGRVIVVGSVNVDLVVRGARLPVPGETVNGGRFERHDGGKGGNQAVAAARLGAAVAFIGAVGDDSFGADARTALEAAGVGVDGLATIPGVATGIALILVDPAGENLISVASGANLALETAHVAAALARLQPGPADVVLVSNELAPKVVEAALRAARAAGARTILNPAPADGIEPAWLELVDILTPNQGELERLAGLAGAAGPDPATAARELAIRQACVVTLGPDGALVVPRAGAPWRVPAPTVEVVDSTGAGDAFNGALAASLADGRSLEESVRRGVAAGSLAATRPGAREGMPTSGELAAELETAPG